MLRRAFLVALCAGAHDAASEIIILTLPKMAENRRAFVLVLFTVCDFTFSKKIWQLTSMTFLFMGLFRVLENEVAILILWTGDYMTPNILETHLENI